MSDTVVSSETEELVLVDEADREVGHRSKAACHDGEGILHRAFSVFLLNPDGEVLLQRRGTNKRLWPGYWANSCCSHPRRGESMELATVRRVREELGVDCVLDYVYKFTYHAQFSDLGAERELCWVYVGTTSEPIRPNRTEIAEHWFVPPEVLDAELVDRPERFTPWLHLEWPRLRTDFPDRLVPAVG